MRYKFSYKVNISIRWMCINIPSASFIMIIYEEKEIHIRKMSYSICYINIHNDSQIF